MRIAFFPLLLGLVVLAACGTNEAPASSTGSDCHGSKKGRAVSDAEKAPVVRSPMIAKMKMSDVVTRVLIDAIVLVKLYEHFKL